MEQEMLIVRSHDITADQLVYIVGLIDKQVDNEQRVYKAKHDLAQALCQINTIRELDDVVSHFINKIVPIFRNNITAWNTTRKEILEQLK